MRGFAAAAGACCAASRFLLSLQHRSAHSLLVFQRIDANLGTQFISASFTSARPGSLLVHRALSSQAEQFSLGWTGDQTPLAGGATDGAKLRFQAQQV